jgi:adenylate kinase family enzyme
MGKSGAGKQPRIDVLAKEFGLKQLSTGDMFRTYLKKFNVIDYEGDVRQFYDKSTGQFAPDEEILKKLGPVAEWEDPQGVLLGLKAKYFVESGKFAPDSITNAMFEAEFIRAGCNGLIMDGFPRTVVQAELLLDLVIHYGTNIDAIVLVDN